MAYKCSDHHYWNTDDVLGHGATCVVFKGISERGEVRALKVFTENHTRDQHREEEALKALSHANIVTFYGIETERITRGRVLVTEYCDGGSLYNFLCESENAYGLSDSDFLTVLHHLTLGLRHLRENGFVHRDIKPGNILRCLDDRGKSVYKLSDFGTARPLTDAQNFQSLVGTEEYLHPQIYQAAFFNRRAKHEFHSATDLWSLGCTLYHTATGKVPFRPHHGRSDKSTMFNMITKKPPGTISGVQTTSGGQVIYEARLPETCPMSEGLQFLLLPLLVGLLETRGDYLWTYDKYFNSAMAVVNKKQIVVLCAVTDKHHFRSVFVEVHDSLSHVRGELSRQCGVSASQQTLLLQDDVIDDAKWPSLHQFPATTPRNPLVLLSRQHNEHPLPNPVHTEIMTEGLRLKFNAGFHLGHEFRQAVDYDHKIAKRLTEQVALMFNQVKVMTMYQQEVLRIRHMLKSKVRARREAVERRMTTAQSLLRQLDTALQGTTNSKAPLSSQLSQMYNKVSEALQWTKVDFPQEQRSLIRHEQDLSDVDWCHQNECTLKMKRLLQQAKGLFVEFGKRRTIMRPPNKPTQLMMQRDRLALDGLYKKAVTLWQEHCCVITSQLMDNLHTWYSAHVDAEHKLEWREAETERLSLDIATSLPSVLQVAVSTKSTKNSLSEQLVKQLLDIPASSPVSHRTTITETMNSLETLTKDLPDVYVAEEITDQVDTQEQQQQEQQQLQQQQHQLQQLDQEKQQEQLQQHQLQQLDQEKQQEQLQQQQRKQQQQQQQQQDSPAKNHTPQENEGQGRGGFLSRLVAGEDESIPFMDAEGWAYISKGDIPS